MVFYDTETCGLHGPIVLIQYAFNDGGIKLHSPWLEPIEDTIALIDSMMSDPDGVVGFNLEFDHFHLCQLYTTLLRLQDRVGPYELPDDYIEHYAEEEKEARFGPCIKPVSACDLMCVARKGPYQSTMPRDDIRIKKVPTKLAEPLARKLDEKIPLNDVYFARKKDKHRRWQVADIYDDVGDVNPEFKDVILRFAPSSALKALAQDALGYDEEDIHKFQDIELPSKLMPVEAGWAPFALAPYQYKDKHGKKRWCYPQPGNWQGKWPEVIKSHISHWGYNRLARQYAEDDVKYTRELYRYFGNPKMGDDDSVLTCMVGAVRWRGFDVDLHGLRELRDEKVQLIKDFEINHNSTEMVKRYLKQVMSSTEQLIIKDSTKGILLEEITKWTKEDVCTNCQGMGCQSCDDGLIKTDEPHPAAERARRILDARHADKEIQLYDKLLSAERFHASLSVIGTKSSRMSGSGGLNPQGIQHDVKVRSKFPLKDAQLPVLSGGDFDAFEVVLMDAAFGDPKMREELRNGYKIHAIFGAFVFDKTYDEIVATKNLGGEQALYTRGKSGVFALAYGGEGHTLTTRLGVPQQKAEEAYQQWCAKYKKWAEERKKIFDMFCSMSQKGGIGTKVEWNEPAEYIESLTGFRRYFTLENKICRALFSLAESPPKEWTSMKFKVVRRDREQTAVGALRSALLAAAFQVQAANMRAAGNHVIQSSGATINKELQRRIWDYQPSGINDWEIELLNIHDEIVCAHKEGLGDSINQTVENFVEEKKSLVPLIAMEWKTNVPNWGEK